MESPFCDAQRDGTRLIETFGYQPEQGIARLELHLARLARSAEALGFVCDLEAVRAAVAAIGGDAALRCRLTLDAGGEVEVTTAEMPAGVGRWVFRFAEERLESGDPYLQHKTTRRAMYDRWRGRLPEGVQEWVFLNERGEVCEGTITNVVVTMPDGARLTPPVASGCLPGVYRESLLAAGAVREAVLSVADLRAAERVVLTNSLRGEILAVWDEVRS